MHWNGVLENAIITGKESPGTQGRVAAIVQSAVYDAVNGIARKYTPLHVLAQAPPGARQEAAAVQAAYTALVAIYPAQKPVFDAEYAVSVAAIPGSQGKSQSISRGLQWGEFVANQILAWRAADGFNSPAPPYFGGDAIGQWRSIPNGGVAAILPQMATLVPFGIESHSQFRNFSIHNIIVDKRVLKEYKKNERFKKALDYLFHNNLKSLNYQQLHGKKNQAVKFF